jgi:hypothetical protein
MLLSQPVFSARPAISARPGVRAAKYRCPAWRATTRLSPPNRVMVAGQSPYRIDERPRRLVCFTEFS